MIFNKTFHALIIIGTLLLGQMAGFVPDVSAQGADEDCVPLNPSNVQIETIDGRLVITDGLFRLLDFDLSQRDEAEKALAIIQHYGLNDQCFVGRPDPSMRYWLADGRSPQGSFPDEDCIPFMNVTVSFRSGSWKIVQGDIFLLDFGANEAEAREALRIILRHGFGFQCFVGRADASMEYYRTDPDRDGDGLLDRWEQFGVDVDFDGVIDIDLPGFGADPDHKDLFLEFDWMTGQAPSQAAIRALKAAFAAAPVNAGGIPNPDGLPGINLWVDTGNLTDANGIEDGAAAGSCGDGIDNGGDGLTDAADPDCLVGDNLGGGNAMAASGISNLNADFYTAKGNNFNANRAMVFRYGISAQPGAGFGGGWGEIGGNDFIEYNHDAGTIMHELGHTLNLRHGGDVNANCKPDYVSVMNYDNQFGINQAGGGRIIDYSPPRFAGGRGQAPLPTLREDNLDEATILDGTDATNQFVFVNGNGQKVRSQLNQRVDWNGDGDTNDSALSVNIDTSGATGRPAACTNTVTNSTLTGHHDWSVIALNFRPFGDSADGAVNPVTEPEPDLEELLQLRQQLNTTDLAVDKTDLPDPVEAGSQLVYTLTVTNNGPNPASQVRLIDTLPAGITYQSNTGGCIQAPAGTLTCDLGELLSAEFRQVSITVLVDGIHVDPAQGPSILTNTGTVDNQAGTESLPNNNTVSEETEVVDTTPPVLTVPGDVTFQADDQCRGSGAIGTATATDLGDPDPVVTNDAPAVFELGENIVTWTATDDSGNAVSGTQIVTVIDVTAPTISVSTTPSLLWPPNHKMVQIVPNIAVADNCPIADQGLETITMDEGDETNTFHPEFDTTLGDGNTVNDIQVDSSGNIFLRSERSGLGDGRIYTLTFGVTDGSGNHASAVTEVVVPHHSN